MRAYLTYRKIATCSHQNTVNGVTGGSERVLCEDCGDVIVRDESMIPRNINRSMFSRDADSVDVTDGASRKLEVLTVNRRRVTRT